MTVSQLYIRKISWFFLLPSRPLFQFTEVLSCFLPVLCNFTGLLTYSYRFGMPSEWQIHKAAPVSWHSPTALDSLYQNADVPKPSHLEPKSVLVRMHAAALNARDLMVMGHDPIYPGDHLEGLVPCADGSGEIVEVGDNSIWKVGIRVMVHLNSWIDQQEPPLIDQIKAMGAADVQGTLRQYAVFVCYNFVCLLSRLPRPHSLPADTY